MKSINKQKGVALFITLLVISIATLLATQMWFTNKIDIAKQANNRSFLQAEHYAQGMVLWAKDVLKKDAENQPRFDNRSEMWNQTITGIQLEDAMLSGKLTEMDSKFNLNNLLNASGDNADQVALLKRILVNLELDSSIVDKVMDWMDADNIPRNQGAEDVVYLSRPPYYRTAGQSFSHISELRLIDSIDEDTYERLKQYVVVIPKLNKTAPATKININLASTVILRSLVTGSSANEAIALFNEGKASFQRLEDFYQDPAVQRYFLGGTSNALRNSLNNMIDTQSLWFQAEINVDMESSYFQKYALVKRSGVSSAIQLWSRTKFD